MLMTPEPVRLLFLRRGVVFRCGKLLDLLLQLLGIDAGEKHTAFAHAAAFRTESERIQRINGQFLGRESEQSGDLRSAARRRTA